MRSPAKAPVSEAGKPLPPDPGPYQQDPEAPFELDPGGRWEAWEKATADDKKAKKGSVTGTYYEDGVEDAEAGAKPRYKYASDDPDDPRPILSPENFSEYVKGYNDALEDLDDEEERRMSRWDDHYDELEAGQQDEGKKIRITKKALNQIIREEVLKESLTQSVKDLLTRDYEVVDEKTRYPYGPNRGDVRRTTIYSRKDGKPVPQEDLNLLQSRDAEIREKHGAWAALSGVYTTTLSSDSTSLIVKYHRHTSG